MLSIWGCRDACRTRASGWSTDSRCTCRTALATGDRRIPFRSRRGGSSRSWRSRECLAPATTSPTTLWPEATEGNASQSLRTAVCDLQRQHPGVLAVRGGDLGLGESVAVDILDLRATAQCLPDTPEVTNARELIDRYAQEVLPDWYDDWLVIVRERWLEVRLHALDLLCERLSAVGRHDLAIDAGVASVAIDPLRETGRRVLINAHLAEGNTARAILEYERFRVLLDRELGISPSPTLHGLLCRQQDVVA